MFYGSGGTKEKKWMVGVHVDSCVGHAGVGISLSACLARVSGGLLGERAWRQWSSAGDGELG